MPIYVDESKCPKDHPCPAVAVCPMGALLQEGTDAPVVDNDQCIDCCACVNTCPSGAIQLKA